MADDNPGPPHRECPPMVTAVIPTRNRPELVTRAVRSALEQTYKQMEVVVVIDGPGAATVNELAKLSDDRLRVIVLPRSLGGSGARNAGVEAARGTWIALLDDDDEWLPVKIDLQMQLASRSRFRYPIVGTQLFGRRDQYEVVWPRITPYEPLSEYLLARNSWSYGEGLMQTSTLLFPRELFCQIPFRPELRDYDDWDWVLRAAKHDGAGIEFISQPLAVWNIPERRSSLSSTTDWQTGLKWIDSVREMITPRAYASFVATRLSSQAANRQDWGALWPLFKTMVKWGKPNFRDVSLYFGMWFAPQRLRLAVRKANR
jgi:glycosyltransferase involved in cell wall biosynthesis